MYQKNGRWWWKVRLPGESRVRERALKPEGARFAAKTRKVAEKVAGEMWRLSIEAEAQSKVRAELKEQTERKNAKVKSEFREKIDQCTGALEDAEARTRAEAALKAEAQQEARSNAEALERVVERVRRETKLRIEAEQRAAMEAQARAMAEARLRAETELRAEARDVIVRETPVRVETEIYRPTGGRRRRSLELADSNRSNGRTAPCEGCGRDGIPENELERIESGQLVCPDCMMLARA